MPDSISNRGELIAPLVDDDLARAALGRYRPAARNLYSDGSAAFEHDPNSPRVGQHGQVPPRSDWPQIGHGSAPSPSVPTSDLIEAGPVLRRSVEVGIVGQPPGLAGSNKGARQYVRADLVGDPERSALPVVFVDEALVVLGLTEIRQDIGIRPSGDFRERPNCRNPPAGRGCRSWR